MKLTDTSISRPVTVSMVVAAVIVFGVVSLGRLRVELLPNISYPSLTIQTEYQDTAPAEVEQFVTRPIEEAIGVLPGLERVRSVSRPGQSEVTLEYVWKTKMDLAALDVREKLDLIELPKGANKPTILRFDPSLDPVMRLRVAGGDDLLKLRRVAEKLIKKELEGLKGVAAARVSGGLEEEIHVELDKGKLSALGIPITRVTASLAGENVNVAGGSITDEESEFLVRTTSEFESVEEIGKVQIDYLGNRPVLLGDLARIEASHKERDVIAKLNGKESVEIAIYKEGDANIVSVAKAVRRKLASLSLPSGIGVTVASDHSIFIQRSVSEVMSAALVGALLATIVLFFFLKDVRTTLTIALSIPVSVVATFLVMYRLGISLNIMSLGGLALGIGMLVDNSIVVLESVFRHRQEEQSLAKAVGRGAQEVSRAILASTLTTVAVFLPLIFVEGIAGQLFRDQALTISTSLLASLAVALTLVPMLSALSLKRRSLNTAQGKLVDDSTAGREAKGDPSQNSGRRAGGMGRVRVLRAFRASGAPISVLFRLFDRLLVWLYDWYPGALRKALEKRRLVLAAAFLTFSFSVLLALLLRVELIPPFSQGEFTFDLRFPEGTPILSTERAVSGIESETMKVPGVHSVFSNSGSTTMGQFTARIKEQNIAQITVTTEHRSDRAEEENVIGVIRKRLDIIPGLSYDLKRPNYFSFRAPIEVEIFGYDLVELRRASAIVEERLGAIPAIKDISSTMKLGSPEVHIVTDRERLAQMNLEPAEVFAALSNALKGEVPTRFRREEDKIDILVRNTEEVRRSLDELPNLVIGYSNGLPVPLASVARIEFERGPSEITRVSQQRAAIVSANLAGHDLGGVASRIRKSLKTLQLPPHLSASLSGQSGELDVSFGSLRFALILAVFLVYLVMASQFESFLHPFVILFTVPLAAIGVVFSLLVTRTAVSVLVLIGAIILAGIVVNNAIVLIDYTNQLRQKGMRKEEAIVTAGKVRLRPILMTTVTTVLGLIPMAVSGGEGAELRAPLAITVIGGLSFATMLTLFVIPALYITIDRSE